MQSIPLLSIFLFLVGFQIKHFLCDFPFQTPYMLGKFKEVGWFKPLLAHAATHAVFTFAIIMGITQNDFVFALFMALLDLSVHFVVDRLKVVLSWKLTSKDSRFWTFIGIDQMLHHFTHYLIVFFTIGYLFIPA